MGGADDDGGDAVVDLAARGVHPQGARREAAERNHRLGIATADLTFDGLGSFGEGLWCEARGWIGARSEARYYGVVVDEPPGVSV